MFTVRTATKYIDKKDAYNLCGLLRSYIQTEEKITGGRIINSFDIDESYKKLRELAVAANADNRKKSFDRYYAYLEMVILIRNGERTDATA